MRIVQYQTLNSRTPFQKWLDSLDKTPQEAVERRISVLRERDHLGDYRSLGNGLYEIRLVGPGLRVYFAFAGLPVVLLLGGSDKGSQKRSIALARYRLKEFKERK